MRVARGDTVSVFRASITASTPLAISLSTLLKLLAGGGGGERHCCWLSVVGRPSHLATSSLFCRYVVDVPSHSQ